MVIYIYSWQIEFKIYVTGFWKSLHKYCILPLSKRTIYFVKAEIALATKYYRKYKKIQGNLVSNYLY